MADPVDRTSRAVVGAQLDDGSPDQRPETDKPDGQHAGYTVLSDAERAKGFVRPVRDSYVHVGAPAPQNLRDLTPEEQARFAEHGYVKWEAYGPERLPLTGRFWRQELLDQVGKGCGSTTTMSRKLAETYARDPGFYGATFCCACGAHFPVGSDGQFVWSGTDERVGT